MPADERNETRERQPSGNKNLYEYIKLQKNADFEIRVQLLARAERAEAKVRQLEAKLRKLSDSD